MRGDSAEFSRISFGNFCYRLGVLMLTAELTRSKPDAAAEHAREQILMAKASHATNVSDRPVGFHQVSFSRFDANTANFGRRSAADHSHETLFKRPTSNGQLTHYIGYMNAFLSAVANKPQRVANDFIIDCQRIGRVANNDSSRRE
jgi:hypothetical protein